MSDRPDPPVPENVDLRDFGFMPLDIVRLFGSRFHAIATDSEWRAGVTLWAKSFHQVPAASLPDDDIELCRLAELGRDLRAWRRLKDVALHGWILCNDGRYYHPVVAEKANEAWARKEAQRERSRRGNVARWGPRGDPGDAPTRSKRSKKDREGNPSAIPEASLKDSLNDPKGQGQGQGQGERQGCLPVDVELPTVGEPRVIGGETSPPNPTEIAGDGKPPPEASKKRPKAPPTGTRLSPDWVLPKAWGDWALGEFPHWDAARVRLEADRFRDHWCAKTRDATKIDWFATWRNWCRSPIAQDRAIHRGNGSATADTAIDLANSAAALLGFKGHRHA